MARLLLLRTTWSHGQKAHAEQRWRRRSHASGGHIAHLAALDKENEEVVVVARLKKRPCLLAHGMQASTVASRGRASAQVPGPP